MSQRYYKGTMDGVTDSIYVKFDAECDVVTYVDPVDSKEKILGIGNKKLVTGEVRSQVDLTALIGTTNTSQKMTFLDPAGGANKEITFPKIAFNKLSGETSQDDTKPAQFGISFVAEWPFPA